MKRPKRRMPPRTPNFFGTNNRRRNGGSLGRDLLGAGIGLLFVGAALNAFKNN